MGKGESILVLDDVEKQRDIASRILKRLGYSVTSVSSGEAAVDYLRDNSADSAFTYCYTWKELKS